MNMVSHSISSDTDGNSIGTRNDASIDDAVIRLAGNSQDGIQTIGGFLARLAGRSAQDVMTYMTIPSTIAGGPSIFQVRIGSGEVLSAGDSADFLVTFYQHSYHDHISFLRDGGILLYDTDHVKPDLSDKRFVYVGVPITGSTIEAVGGAAKDKGKNIYTLGLLVRIFNLNVRKLRLLLEERFGSKGEDVLRNALLAFDAGYGYHVDNVLLRFFQFEASDKTETSDQVTMDGNSALTLGLITAGVRFGAGYPITPWSPIMESLRAELPKYGGTFIQAEDELSAISSALGFSYAGHLAVTGSSGPGMSLKMEALSWGVMAEIPVIVINVQRGGPSTGLPTSVEQSDLLQAIYGSHGDSPRIVLSPMNVEDCYYIAIEAARYAREYSVPVIILSDQSLATRIEAFNQPDIEANYIDPTPDLSPREDGFIPYSLHQRTHHAPPGTPMKGGVYPVVTGLEHDEAGHPTANPQLHMRMTAKRREKLKHLGRAIPRPQVFGDEEGDILLIGWGSTYGPLREAVKRSHVDGNTIAHLHIRHLHPLPNGLERIFSRYRQIFVVEMNDEGLYGYGQLATILRARYANNAIRSITKTDGLPFKVREIREGISRLRGDATVSFSAYPTI
jgi:2-oxoglutarate ferredoxin oxidoreductase subunit alpha